MPKRPDPYLIDDDNPELTPEQIRAMRSASDVLPPELYASLVAGYEAQQAARAAGPKKVSGMPRKHLRSGGA